VVPTTGTLSKSGGTSQPRNTETPIPTFSSSTGLTEGTCYDGCGWQQVSTTYYPGQNLQPLVGKEVYLGYALWQGNWWAWFDNQWLGYFPASLWQNQYKRATLVQWFGEVASDNDVPPGSEMGFGIFPASSKSARMLELCIVHDKDGACAYGDQPSVIVSPHAAAKYYGVKRLGGPSMRYGGPGK
jgi:hypothetical protein